MFLIKILFGKLSKNTTLKKHFLGTDYILKKILNKFAKKI